MYERDCRFPGHSARSDVHILPEILAGFAPQRPKARVAIARYRAAMHEIDAELPERQCLAQVPDDDLQLRKAVENPARDDAQQMQSGFHGEAVNCALKPALEKGSNHLPRRSI